VCMSCTAFTVREVESISVAQVCDSMCRPFGGALDFTTQPPVCRCVEPRSAPASPGGPRSW
jgi:hypothetical protein